MREYLSGLIHTDEQYKKIGQILSMLAHATLFLDLIATKYGSVDVN